MGTTTKVRFTTQDFIRIDPERPRVLEACQRPEGTAYLEEATYTYDDEISVQERDRLGSFSMDDLLG